MVTRLSGPCACTVLLRSRRVSATNVKKEHNTGSTKCRSISWFMLSFLAQYLKLEISFLQSLHWADPFAFAFSLHMRHGAWSVRQRMFSELGLARRRTSAENAQPKS